VAANRTTFGGWSRALFETKVLSAVGYAYLTAGQYIYYAVRQKRVVVNVKDDMLMPFRKPNLFTISAWAYQANGLHTEHISDT
jgi:hypothetical protein